jgi:signal transduction histidine kinase
VEVDLPPQLSRSKKQTGIIRSRVMNEKKLISSKVFKNKNGTGFNDSVYNQTSLQRKIIGETQFNFLILRFNRLSLSILLPGSLILLIIILALMVFRHHRFKQQTNKQLEAANKALEKALGDLKSTQLQLIQSEKMASLGQLTAGIAHEINNPINFVSANISPLKRNLNDWIMLLEKYNALKNTEDVKLMLEQINQYKNEIGFDYTIEETMKLLNGIEEGSKRTAEIVKGLRSFSRLDEEEKKKSDINEGLESTLVLLQNKLKHQNIEIIKSFADLPLIECYPGQLNQVFLNLLTNGIDAIGSDGKIFITTSIQENAIRISIRDNGPGMTEDVKQKIFDPFFTTKEAGKGTGLGLSISFGIIEKHNGKIDANSELGKGTEFVITLPTG